MSISKEVVELMLQRAVQPILKKMNGENQFTAVDISLVDGTVLTNVEEIDGPNSNGLIELSFQDQNRSGYRRRVVFHASSVVCVSAESFD